MSYTPPSSDAVEFSIESYTSPSSDAIDFTIGPVGAVFEVGIITAPSEIIAGEDFDIDVEIENTGVKDGTQTIDAQKDGTTTTTRDVSLTVGATTTEVFALSTDIERTSDLTVTAASEDTSSSTTIAVVEPTFNLSRPLFAATPNATYQQQPKQVTYDRRKTTVNYDD